MKYKILVLLLIVMGLHVHAQIRISDGSATANATLEIDGEPTVTTTADGLIPPRLTRKQLVGKDAAYTTTQTGAFVYITDVSGVISTATANVTSVGLYYFDGTLWQPLKSDVTYPSGVSSSGNVLTSTVQDVTDTANLVTSVSNTNVNNTLTTTVNGVASSGAPVINSSSLALLGYNLTGTVNGVTSNAVTLPNLYNSSSTLTGNRVVTLADKNLSFTTSGYSGTGQFTVDGSTFSVNTVNNRIGLGTSPPIARLDMRSNAGNTSNPGNGYLAIGTTDIDANAAGAGAIRYTTESGGTIQYSDGANWHQVESNVQKSIVVAKKTTSQTINQTVDPVLITNWNEVTDTNGDFNPSTGAFTAPRTGNYIISFGFNFNASSINGGTQVEAILFSPLGTAYFKKSVIAFPRSGYSQAGAVITFAIRMNAGEVYRPSVWHNTGSSKTLRVANSGSNSGYCNFSVREL
ncbi:hypothetical protein [Neptunitalea lumnitzerae]|uniref:C1q domain-containing protein n=1 Tax=Neptunitalea lumnitzerae TaxID=2965509 RepID=A0ABQ5MG82_9FLAO|nr:hypothetical protein [Neptunitalea sp. Y10]GLB48424.1 hypothetical protein Y10_07920 [Neptunitalea sp. Y10]